MTTAESEIVVGVSPHTRGSTPQIHPDIRSSHGFPAHAGIDLCDELS